MHCTKSYYDEGKGGIGFTGLCWIDISEMWEEEGQKNENTEARGAPLDEQVPQEELRRDANKGRGEKQSEKHLARATTAVIRAISTSNICV
jgi:hypothetical protein